MTICRNCGKETNELVLLGNRDYVHMCRDCDNMEFIGGSGKNKCPKCGSNQSTKRVRRLGESERLATGLCDECAENDRKIKQVVQEGGIYWRCKDCRSSGAIRAETPIAKEVRAKLQMPPPAACGIEFTKEECPVCTGSVETGHKATEEQPTLLH